MIPPRLRPFRLAFRIALRRAVYKAWRAGEIKGEQAYLLLDVIQGERRGGRYYNKGLLEEVEILCRKELIPYDQMAADTGDIDWANWIDLLVTWLPLILKLLLLCLSYSEAPTDEPPEERTPTKIRTTKTGEGTNGTAT